MLRPDVAWEQAGRAGRGWLWGCAIAAFLDTAQGEAASALLTLALLLISAGVLWVWLSMRNLLTAVHLARRIILEQDRQNKETVGMANIVIKGNGPDGRKGGR